MNCLAESRKPVPEPFALPFGGAFRWIARGVDGIARAIEGRRMLRQLAKSDDRMLKDMGLSRSDLRNAAAEPLYRDPTTLLAGHVDEARVGRRSARGCARRADLGERARRGRPVPYY